MADVHLTIDGVEITVSEGTNVADAARTVDIAIPVFCYHPKIKAAGMCRMCLVAVGNPRVDRLTGQAVLDEQGNPIILWMPKLQTACTTPVSEGMVVQTKTPEVKFAQRGILEFLLTSHPLDCPVCDKGGECPLQNLTMEWGPSKSRFAYDNKVHFEKPVPLGNLIFLDRERCILCGRCVRFEDQLADDSVLGFDHRGRKWQITSVSEPLFDSKFSGNTTDICPVGALTSADFRFRARVWEIQPVPSICPHCSVGCNLTLDIRHQELKRVMPRENIAVNDIWLCDKGRFGQRFLESKERLTTPLVRHGSRLQPASWSEALQAITEKFAALHKHGGGEVFAGLAGEYLSNEDLYLFQRLFRDILKSNHLNHQVGTLADLQDDDLSAEIGVGSGTNLLTLGTGTTILVFGADPEEEAPLYMLRLRGIAQRGGNLIVANPRPTKLGRSATCSLIYRPGTESQLLRGLLLAVLEEIGPKNLPNVAGLAELRAALNPVSLKTAAKAAEIREEDLREVAKQFVQAENGIIVYGAEALALGPALTQDLANLAILTGKVGKPNNGLLALLPCGNSRGVLDMGVRPDRGPGYAPLPNRGLTTREIWSAAMESRIRSLYIVGLDPVKDYPVSSTALEKLDFIVVQDMFLTATAKIADVVLPAAAFAECDGTYTNAERRVQRARQALPPPGESRPNWEIIQDVAKALADAGIGAAGSLNSGKKAKSKMQEQDQISLFGWNYLTVNEVAKEIAERVPGYAGITHTSLASTGKAGAWGRQTNEAFYYDGTSYENTEGVGIQYPAAIEGKYRPALKILAGQTTTSDKRYPFSLLVKHLLYDNDSLLCDSLLLAHIPMPHALLNPNDAQKLDLKPGSLAQLASLAGSVEIPVQISSDVPEGSILVPANLPNDPLIVIQTGPRTRVSITKVAEFEDNK